MDTIIYIYISILSLFLVTRTINAFRTRYLLLPLKMTQIHKQRYNSTKSKHEQQQQQNKRIPLVFNVHVVLIFFLYYIFVLFKISFKNRDFDKEELNLESWESGEKARASKCKAKRERNISQRNKRTRKENMFFRSKKQNKQKRKYKPGHRVNSNEYIQQRNSESVSMMHSHCKDFFHLKFLHF